MYFTFMFNFGTWSDCTDVFTAIMAQEDTSTYLGLFIQWMALTGVVLHMVGLVWGLWACCRRTARCPFEPSTRYNAGRAWAWQQMHPTAPSPRSYDGPRQRQGGKGLASLIRSPQGKARGHMD